MAKIPTYEEMAKKVAEKALDEIYGGKTIREWIEILVKQKPWEGEDCISRQVVLDKMKERDEELSSICPRDIRELPSVTPQPKTGHWIAVENEEMETISYYCSECDLPMETEEKTRFCPNCGCRMVEPQESEGEE